MDVMRFFPEVFSKFEQPEKPVKPYIRAEIVPSGTVQPGDYASEPNEFATTISDDGMIGRAHRHYR